MSAAVTSHRIQTVGEALSTFVSLVTSPVFNQLLEDPQACDFVFGNPHEMPLEGFVAALQRWNIPQNKDWYAYKMNEPEISLTASDEMVARALPGFEKAFNEAG